MSDDMPKEIYAYYKEHGTGSWIDFDDSCKGDEATPYTFTSHHTAEIAKRDRAIEVLRNKMMHLATCSDPFVVDKAERALEEAQAILKGGRG